MIIRNKLLTCMVSGLLTKDEFLTIIRCILYCLEDENCDEELIDAIGEMTEDSWNTIN
jgi:hypothetical protein